MWTFSGRVTKGGPPRNIEKYIDYFRCPECRTVFKIQFSSSSCLWLEIDLARPFTLVGGWRGGGVEADVLHKSEPIILICSKLSMASFCRIWLSYLTLKRQAWWDEVQGHRQMSSLKGLTAPFHVTFGSSVMGVRRTVYF
jgi:hypothetical protein